MSVKKTSVVEWFIMVRIGLIESPLFLAAFMSTMNTDRPSVRFLDCSFGVVRASRIIRSEYSARLVQIFWPLTIQLSLPSRFAKVFSDEVSVPLVGSVTPNACSRNSPLAIFGRHFSFCSSLPWRRSVPMVYIWAWQPPPLHPERWISSRIAAAADNFSPAPPYSSGINTERYPACVDASTNAWG